LWFVVKILFKRRTGHAEKNHEKPVQDSNRIHDEYNLLLQYPTGGLDTRELYIHSHHVVLRRRGQGLMYIHTSPTSAVPFVRLGIGTMEHFCSPASSNVLSPPLQFDNLPSY
jgi:hypothetical protein